MESSREGGPPLRDAAPAIADALSSFVAAVDFDTVPSPVLHRARLLLLDAIGVGLAAASFEFGQITARSLQALEPGSSKVLGMPLQLGLRNAALVNGVLIHGLDYDDTSISGRIHPSSACVPTALALAAVHGRSGRELLNSYIAGLECGIRLATVAKGEFQRNGFQPTGIIGAFAATMTAGRLLSLTPRQLTMAQGIALSMAAGSQEFTSEMAWTKRLHAGWASVGGITAATLAQGGFIGPTRPYDGQHGLFRLLLGRQGEIDADVGSLGTTWCLDEIAVKPVPACYFNVGPIDAAVWLAREHGLSADRIARVTVLLPEPAVKAVCEPQDVRRRPRDPYVAQFSVYFAVACALVKQRFTLAELGPDALVEEEVLSLSDRVTYGLDPDTTFPRYYSATVRVETTDGRLLERRESIHRGAPERPLGEEGLRAKFFENATRIFDMTRAEVIWDTVMRIDDLADAGELERITSTA